MSKSNLSLIFLLSASWILLFLSSASGQSQLNITKNGLNGKIIASHMENEVTQTLVLFDFGKYAVYICDHEEHDPIKALGASCCLQPLKTALKSFPWTDALAKNYLTQKDALIFKQTTTSLVIAE